MILVADFDLFKNVGGGQTAYRAVIERSPDRDFTYFVKDEPADALRPSNARAIPFEFHYRPNTGDMPAELSHFYSNYLEAWQLARSVAEAMPGAHFEAVDIPDYYLTGLFLASALRAHGIRVDRTTIALHGTISSALRSQWPNTSSSSRKLAELRLREHLQYRAAEGRYALSESYADEWSRTSGGHVAHAIDPLLISGEFDPKPARNDEEGAPSLLFVGRRERRKGPDLFIDIAWTLDRESIGSVRMFGGDSISEAGVSSKEILERLASKRSISLEMVEAVPRSELDHLFEGRSLVVLPSRYDQFNLVALEALRLGCPVFVSEKAGVSGWIRSRLGSIANDLVFPLSGARAGAAKIRNALADYDKFRGRLIEALNKSNLQADAATLESMYAPADRRDRAAGDALAQITARLDSFHRPRELQRAIKPVPSHPVDSGPATPIQAIKQKLLASPLRPTLDRMYTARQRLLEQLKPRTPAIAGPGAPSLNDLRRRLGGRSDRAMRQIDHARDIEGVRQRLLQRPERTQTEIVEKLRHGASETTDILVARAHIYRDMARIERKRRGGDIVAATYELRVMRWLGEDRYDRLPFTTGVLQDGGFNREASVAEAMMARDEEGRFARCLELMNEQYERCREMPSHHAKDFAVVEDRRAGRKPRAGVIVSLYNAASKLTGFLEALAEQTLARDGELEIVLVDSGSPANEAGVAKAFMDAHKDLPIVFARTKNRETIQAAWNRGIALSQAPYLAFLGVDEGLHPDGLRILAAELDAKPDVDWVMADSIVTEVDKQGAYVSDVMMYDRAGYGQFLVSLETCYLSWVGALYRRSIHERFGAYDSAFRAAGDTEFKSRLLSRLKTAHVPQLLGVFNNYPEERTTQHPRAEIEDLRAWYLYRTPAGMAYLFDGRPIADAEDAFRVCLSYRKSFFDYLSTDFDVAHSLAVYMTRRGENPEFAAKALASSSAMLKRIQMLEELSFLLSPDERQYAVALAMVEAKEQEWTDASDFGLSTQPRYEIFNDNRYEQHWYSWSGG